jgi:enoyl-CoA hydratase/carnithine racemase
MMSQTSSEVREVPPVVTSRTEGPVVWIRLNRPDRLNAMNGPLVARLTQALAEANSDPAIRVIILHGAGRAFCSGDDLKDIDSQTGSVDAATAWIESIQNVTRQIMESDKIVIAAVHGWCVGGALEWVINCDFRIFADTAGWFFPEVGYGLFVTGGVTALLTKQVGPQIAKELMILGEHHDAAAALRYGIAWKVVPEADLLSAAHVLASKVAAKPVVAVSDIKRAINQGFHSSLAAAMDVETEATVRGFLSPESQELAKAF